jgi:quinone-modifying oxidoreductase subunit QmoC
VAAQAMVIQPDTVFLREVMAAGGGDLKKCYQCATCSVVCELSPEESPFPRKQMIEAQWGLKAQLLGDPAIWLCHNCGECTKQCPRGAHPSEVLGALRNLAIQNFAFPKFMGRLVASRKGLPLLFLLPTLIFLAIARWAPKGQPTAHLEFANVFPIPVLEPLFFTVSGLVLLAFGVSIYRCIQATKALDAGGKITQGLVLALKQIVTHERFWSCDMRNWSLGHLLTMWGFIGLGIVGTVTGIGTMIGVLRTPLAFTSALKIFANLSAVVILCGGVVLLVERARDPLKRAASNYFDWYFLLTLVGVALTGILAEAMRLAQIASFMYPVYFVHLVLIFTLFLYAPYSKFAHLAYRTVAVAETESRTSDGTKNLGASEQISIRSGEACEIGERPPGGS